MAISNGKPTGNGNKSLCKHDWINVYTQKHAHACKDMRLHKIRLGNCVVHFEKNQHFDVISSCQVFDAGPSGV